MRWCILAATLLMFPARASDLYGARAIVTGTDGRVRVEGFYQDRMSDQRMHDGAVPAAPGATTLSGTLVWRPEAFGWVGEWRALAHGSEVRWGISGVSFDEAFRNVVREAMRALR